MRDPVELAERVALLRRLPYFASLEPTVVESVATRAQRRTARAGEVLFLEGEACAGLFIVQSGRVKISRMSAEGREHILHFAGPGEAFNDVPVFDGGPNPATVEAIGDSQLLVIPRSAMLELFERYPRLAQAVVAVLAGRCRQLVGQIEDLSLRSVTARLAGLLLDQADQPQAPPLTRAQMAARLGTVREVVSRALRELEAEGYLRLEGPRIVLLDGAGLRRRAGR